MCTSKPRNYSLLISGYTLPRYHEGKSCYVDFFYLDPQGKKQRKKISLNAIKGKRLRREQAERIIRDLLTKLESGWRPWNDVNTVSGKGYERIDEIFDKYLKRLSTLRPKSQSTYRSKINIFRVFLAEKYPAVTYLYQIDRPLINNFLDWLLTERNVEPRTRNNYLHWLVLFLDFCVERGYLEGNAAAGIGTIRENVKIRRPLSQDMIQKVEEYLEKENPHFLLAVMMEYYAMIRPGELIHLRLSDISIKNHNIFVSGVNSKNHQDAYVALNDRLIRKMLELGVFEHSADCYLFSKGFRPGKHRISRDAFNRAWKGVQQHFGWEHAIMFYSLKDSGIRDLANDAGIVVARNQARHSDISTTNKYLQGEREVSKEALTFTGGFKK